MPRLIKLTSPHSQPRYINADRIFYLEPCDPEKSGTEVLLDGAYSIFVNEPINVVLALINGVSDD